MNASADAAPDAGPVSRLGFADGQVVQELGWDDDVDDDFRFAVEDACGADLEDEDYTGAVDAVLLWWRDGDGDLFDTLVDAASTLEQGGSVVLLTPRPGLAGEVDATVLDEASGGAGLHAAGTVKIGQSWRATRLAPPRARR